MADFQIRHYQNPLEFRNKPFWIFRIRKKSIIWIICLLTIVANHDSPFDHPISPFQFLEDVISPWKTPWFPSHHQLDPRIWRCPWALQTPPGGSQAACGPPWNCQGSVCNVRTLEIGVVFPCLSMGLVWCSCFETWDPGDWRNCYSSWVKQLRAVQWRAVVGRWRYEKRCEEIGGDLMAPNGMIPIRNSWRQVMDCLIKSQLFVG